MDTKSFWAENKKAIITTAVVTIVALLIIKYFGYILAVGVIVAIAVAAVLGWNYLSKKHGGVGGVWKAFIAELGIK